MMGNGSIWRAGDGTFYRILEDDGEAVFAMDCTHLYMPRWLPGKEKGWVCSTEEAMMEALGVKIRRIEELSPWELKRARERFTMIAGILAVMGDEKKRLEQIRAAAELYGVSRQTVRHCLCSYLAYRDIAALAPAKRDAKKELTPDEKNIRWGLNSFYYTKKKRSLKEAYTLMLKEKYCDEEGKLMGSYPSFYQFRYFYRKHRSMENYYISREGLSSYRRDHRPLTGGSVREFASHVGVGMLDSTICDIYLVNDAKELVGRPILTACIDGFSGLCCGYMLSWEGGVYSLRGLLVQVLSDKKKWCGNFGISIEKDDWDVDALPGTMVTDMGSEYASGTFSQITELGVSLVNLPAYRPELKGPVEKFFDLVQGYYKPHLKGKGVIDPDFGERGVHDYRNDASLTMEQFKAVILHCIIYYNTGRVVENYPYTQDMQKACVIPHAANIWNYGKGLDSADLIAVTKEELILVLLPRAKGTFTRFGLKANRLRYKNSGFTERYLQGGGCEVAYNPEDVSKVWLVEKGTYIPFTLVESRYEGMTLSQADEMEKDRRKLVNETREESLQAQIDLAAHIEAIAGGVKNHVDVVSGQSVRRTRQREKRRAHKNYLEGGINGGGGDDS